MHFVTPWWQGVISWFVMAFVAASLLLGDAFLRLVEPLLPVLFVIGLVLMLLPFHW